MRGHYLTNFRGRLHRCDNIDGRSGRVFWWAGCGRLTIICNRCDRGNIYCSPECSQRARRSKQRAANKRCQGTRAGRKKHAERASRYRARTRIAAHRTTQARPRLAPNRHDQPNTNHAASACPPCDQQKKVTYQGSFSCRSDGLVSSNSTVTSRQWAQDRLPSESRVRCHKCRRRVPFLRVQFLRDRPRIVQRPRGSHHGHPP